jgi:hypothetical protein
MARHPHVKTLGGKRIGAKIKKQVRRCIRPACPIFSCWQTAARRTGMRASKHSHDRSAEGRKIA